MKKVILVIGVVLVVGWGLTWLISPSDLLALVAILALWSLQGR